MTEATPSPAQRTVERLYAAFAARDELGLRELLHPDVAWNQCEGFPGGASRRGAEDVIAGVLRGNDQRWTGFSVDVERFLVDGPHVVVLGAYAGTHAETGRRMRSVFAHVYEVDAGRVRRFDQIADTWPMVQASQA